MGGVVHVEKPIKSIKTRKRQAAAASLLMSAVCRTELAHYPGVRIAQCCHFLLPFVHNQRSLQQLMLLICAPKPPYFVHTHALI